MRASRWAIRSRSASVTSCAWRRRSSATLRRSARSCWNSASCCLRCASCRSRLSSAANFSSCSRQARHRALRPKCTSASRPRSGLPSWTSSCSSCCCRRVFAFSCCLSLLRRLCSWSSRSCSSFLSSARFQNSLSSRSCSAGSALPMEGSFNCDHLSGSMTAMARAQAAGTAKRCPLPTQYSSHLFSSMLHDQRWPESGPAPDATFRRRGCEGSAPVPQASARRASW